LHPNDVEAEPIFSGDLMALREVVNLLVLVQSLIKIAFARRGRPENVPFV